MNSVNCYQNEREGLLENVLCGEGAPVPLEIL